MKPAGLTARVLFHPVALPRLSLLISEFRLLYAGSVRTNPHGCDALDSGWGLSLQLSSELVEGLWG